MYRLSPRRALLSNSRAGSAYSPPSMCHATSWFRSSRKWQTRSLPRTCASAGPPGVTSRSAPRPNNSPPSSRPISRRTPKSFAKREFLCRNKEGAASPAQRFVQHPSKPHAGLPDLDLDHGRRLRVVLLPDRDHVHDLVRAGSGHRKERIDGVSRDPVTLVDPTGNRALLPSVPIAVDDRRRNDRTLAAAVHDQPAHHVDVPDGVQVEAAVWRVVAFPEKGHLHPVAAPVAAVGGVQRLVDVADEMHDPLEGLVALPGPRAFVAEQFDLARELGGSAAAAAAILRVLRGTAKRHVVIVPGSAPLAPVRVLDFIGPVRDLAESVPAGGLAVGEAVVFEEFQDLCIGLRPGVAGRDFAHHAMSLRAPGKSGLRRPKREERAKDPRVQQAIATPVTAAENRCRARACRTWRNRCG